MKAITTQQNGDGEGNESRDSMKTNRWDSVTGLMWNGRGLMWNGRGRRVKDKAMFLSWLSVVPWKHIGVRGGGPEEGTFIPGPEVV